MNNDLEEKSRLLANDAMIGAAVDGRGWFICYRKTPPLYLYNNSNVYKTAAEQAPESTAFWGTKKDAEEFFVLWSRKFSPKTYTIQLSE